MGKMSCTDHLHTSPIVKDPYSNCGLGTERLHGWHPPSDGRRVYERHTGPVGSGWEVRRRGRGRAGGQWAAGVTRRACRYGSGQGPVHAATRVPPPVPAAPPTPPPRACGLPSRTLAPRRGEGPPWRGGMGAAGAWRGAGRNRRPGRGPVGPNGGCRSPKRGGGARRRPHVIEYSPVGGLGLGCAAGAGDSPVEGASGGAAAFGGREGPRAGPPRGSRRRGTPGGTGAGRAARTTSSEYIYIYICTAHQQGAPKIYILAGWVGPPGIRQLRAGIRQLAARIRQLAAKEVDG